MSKEIKVAILAIVSALILYFGFYFLKGSNVFSSEQYFSSVFEEIDLLVPGDQVLLNGIQVGQVSTTTLNPETGLITVEFSVRNDIKIPKGTVATIFSADLLGDKAMRLAWPKVGQKNGFYEDGAIIEGNVDKGMTEMLSNELLPVKDQISKMLVSMDTILNGVNRILETKQLDTTLASVNTITKNLAVASSGLDKTINSLSAQLEDLMGDFKQISTTLVDNQDELNSIIANTEKITTDFTKLSGNISEIDMDKYLQSFETTLNSANAAVAQASELLDGLNSGKGTAGAILKDRKIYDNLDKVTADLDSVLVDFKKNPKRYVHLSLIDRTAKIEAKERRRQEKRQRKEERKNR